MADTVFRIELTDQGGTPAPPGGGPAPPPPPPAPAGSPPPAGPSGGGVDFDPAAEARRRLEREQRARAVEEEYARLTGRPAAEEFDPAAVARKRLEAEQRARAVEREYARLAGEPVEVEAVGAETAENRARARLARERRGAADREAYEALTRPVTLKRTPGQRRQDARGRLRSRKLGHVATRASQAGRLAYQMGAGAVGQGLQGVSQIAGGLRQGGEEGALGAAGGAVLVADAASRKAAQLFDDAGRAVENFGHATAQAAGNDYLGAFNTGVRQVTDTLNKVPVVGQALGAMVDNLAAPVRAVAEAANAFVERGRQLQGFSPELAGANANAEIRSLSADIREANQLGPEIARLTEAQSRAETEFRELMLPIKKVIVEMLADVLETLVAVIREIRTDIDLLREYARAGVELLNDVLGTGHIADIDEHLKDMRKNLKDIRDKAEKGDKDDDASKIMDAFLRQHPFGAGQAVPAAPPGMNPALGGLPLIPGGVP